MYRTENPGCDLEEFLHIQCSLRNKEYQRTLVSLMSKYKN